MGKFVIKAHTHLRPLLYFRTTCEYFDQSYGAKMLILMIRTQVHQPRAKVMYFNIYFMHE